MTKSQKRHLRGLAVTAYDREFGAALRELQGHFARWQAGEVDAWNLVQTEGPRPASRPRCIARIFGKPVEEIFRWEDEEGDKS